MFNRHDIRRGMEVATRDGRLLGTVVWVRGGAEAAQPMGATCPGSPYSFSGEATGPVTTAAIGNSGPAAQGRAAGYGVGAERPTVSSGLVRALLVARWFGLGGIRWVGADRVVNLSLERVIVDDSV